MFSHLPGSSPGAPVAAGTPIATLTPSPPSTASTASTTSATFVARDTTTRGNWKGVYGSAGYIIAGDTQQIPSTIQVTSTQARPYTWARSTADTRALARPENPSLRIAGSWYSHTSFTFEVNITDGHPYQLALYVLDWGHWNLVETASVVDARSGRVLNTQHLSGFGNGEYLVWRVSGHVTIRITNNATGPNNAVVSALFFAHSIPA